MAENKKNFLIYTSWATWLDVMSNEEKGEWLSWVMSYCNDENPDLPQNPAVKMGCLIAKENLKRDLTKYQAKVDSIKQAREKRLQSNLNENTLKSQCNHNEINMKSICNHNETISDNVNVNVNVNDNVNVNKKENNYVIKEKVVNDTPLTPLQRALNDFISMRIKIKKPLTALAKTRLLNRLEVLSKGNEEMKIAILNQSVDHCWQDIYELKEDNQVKQEDKSNNFNDIGRVL